MGGQLAQVGSEAVPELAAAALVVPVGDAERTHVAAGGAGAGERGEVDRAPEPPKRPAAAAGVGVEQQVAAIRAQSRERRVQRHAVPAAGGGDGGRLLAQRPVGVEVDQIEAVLHHVEPERLGDELRPARRLGPALDGEAGVDTQGVGGRAHESLQS